MTHREAYWAGRFYPADPDKLAEKVAELTPLAETTHRLTGLIAPHAGYRYSGAVAGGVFAQAEVPRTVVLLGPKHRVEGAPAAIQLRGTWTTPGGTVRIAADLAARIHDALEFLRDDDAAHAREHSLEVEIPFLRHRQPDLRIVPIVLGVSLRPADAASVGERLAAAIADYGEPVLMVASTDMHHQGLDDLPLRSSAADVVRERDALALEHIDAFDPGGLLSVCRAERITMCGVVPTAVMMEAARHLGAGSPRRVAHTNSHEVAGGDGSWVVGYAGYTLA